jgi:hypothetical protein
MAVDFAMSGGNLAFAFSGSVIPGISTISGGSISSTAPGSNEQDTFALSNAPALRTINLGGNYSTLYAGARFYVTNFGTGLQLIVFYDAGANLQCDLRFNGSGQLYFTRNGTTIGTTSAYALSLLTWNYIEFKAILSTTSGTCEVRVNGSVVATASGLNNAASSVYGATAAMVEFQDTFNPGYIKDMYVVDGNATSFIMGSTVTGVFQSGETVTQSGTSASATIYGIGQNGRITVGTITGSANSSGVWTGAISGATFSPSYAPITAAASYLGDVRIFEVYPNGPGVNSTWAANVGPFTVTAVSGSGSSWTFTGSWTTGASNIYEGYYFNTTSCGTGNNQTGVLCTASANGSLTLSFSGGSAQTGLTGSAAFQNPLQIGIATTNNASANAGTRPNGDNVYISDSTAGNITDYAHQSIVLSGVIVGLFRLSYMRKDDAGSRSVAQICLSGSATALTTPESLANTYQYWIQILEADPNTLTGWTVSGFNAATFGVKELT